MVVHAWSNFATKWWPLVQLKWKIWIHFWHVLKDKFTRPNTQNHFVEMLSWPTSWGTNKTRAKPPNHFVEKYPFYSFLSLSRCITPETSWIRVAIAPFLFSPEILSSFFSSIYCMDWSVHLDRGFLAPSAAPATQNDTEVLQVLHLPRNSNRRP